MADKVNKQTKMDDFLNKKVKAIEVEGPKTVSQLLSEMAETGFQGKSLARGVDGIAVITSVFGSPDPENAARELATLSN